MQVIGFLIKVIIVIIALPFMLIDYVFIELPKEYIANRWRKNVKVGDRAYFINLMETRTYGNVTKIYKNGEVGFKTSNSQGPRRLRNLYPAKKDDY